MNLISKKAKLGQVYIIEKSCLKLLLLYCDFVNKKKESGWDIYMMKSSVYNFYFYIKNLIRSKKVKSDQIYKVKSLLLIIEVVALGIIMSFISLAKNNQLFILLKKKHFLYLIITIVTFEWLNLSEINLFNI